MNNERSKILKMVQDGIITPEEAKELLDALGNKEELDIDVLSKEEFREKSENAKKAKRTYFDSNKLKEDLNKIKEELLYAKDKIVEEVKAIDSEKIKTEIKKGYDKIDQALGKIDNAIVSASKKFAEEIKGKKDKKGEEE